MSKAPNPTLTLSSLSIREFLLRDRAGNERFPQATCSLPVGKTVWIRSISVAARTQFLRVLAGLEDPVKGSYWINGRDVTAMEFSEFAPFQRRIGYGFEYGGLISNQTLSQNLMLPFLYHRDLSTEEARTRVTDSLEAFGLTRYSHRRPATCTGGNRKATCVARSLITWPELLILDNPTVGLDEKAVRSLVSLIGIHRRERGLKHVYIASDDERFMRSLSEVVELELSELNHQQSEEARAAA